MSNTTTEALAERRNAYEALMADYLAVINERDALTAQVETWKAADHAMQEQAAEYKSERDALAQALEKIIRRWDSPLWRQEVHTAEIINDGRQALAALRSQPQDAQIAPAGYKLVTLEWFDWVSKLASSAIAEQPDRTAVMRQALGALEGTCTNPLADPEQAVAEDAAIAALRAALGGA